MKTIRALLFVIVLLGSHLLAGCDASPDEVAIRETIKTMRGAIENHDANLLMQAIADDYSGTYRQDRKRLNDFVARHLERNRVIHLYLADIELEIEGEIAKVRFYSGIAGGPGQVPERGQLYVVETDWVKRENTWLLQRARWRPKLFVPNPG